MAAYGWALATLEPFISPPQAGATDRYLAHQVAAYAYATLLMPKEALRQAELGLAACEAANLAAKNSIQVHGAMGVTEDTPLERMYRQARFARIYDGPDEVHITTTARRILGASPCRPADSSSCSRCFSCL